jgi:hypothetical protein
MPEALNGRRPVAEGRKVKSLFTLPHKVDRTLTLLGRGMRAAFLFGLPALLLASPAEAQTTASHSATPRALGQTTLVYPLTMIVRSHLDFGYLAASGAGTAVIDPNTGVMSVTGGVSSLGGNPRPATFVGAAKSSVVVNIKLPNQPITLVRSGGPETMQVRNFTLQGQDKRAIARMTSFEFNVGGTLVVAADQAEGIYSGSFEVIVQYP